MEIYRNSTAAVRITVPVTPSTGTMDVRAFDGDTELYVFQTVTAVTGGFEVTLPFSLVDRDRDFVIKWAFDYVEGGVTKTYKTEVPVSVVTPYANIAEIREILGTQSAQFTDSQIRRAERAIRGVINSFTGQSFGRFEGTRKVIGAGDGQLRLPQRLVSISSITGANLVYTLGDYYAVRGDGWYLGFATPSPDGDWVFTHVIRDPDSLYDGGFRDNVVYNITGVWGYEDLPSDVKEAALLLIEKHLCPDTEYRDRYIDSVRAADWRYEFNPQAFNGTGSVVADQLLEPYRRYGMTVI